MGIHQFTNASNLACSTATIAVVEQGTDKVKGLLATKSRIAKRNTPLPLPKFCTEVSRPFQHTGVDFAGPLIYRVGIKEASKAYVIIFTCVGMRAVRLEVTSLRQQMNSK